MHANICINIHRSLDRASGEPSLKGTQLRVRSPSRKKKKIVSGRVHDCLRFRDSWVHGSTYRKPSTLKVEKTMQSTKGTHPVTTPDALRASPLDDQAWSSSNPLEQHYHCEHIKVKIFRRHLCHRWNKTDYIGNLCSDYWGTKISSSLISVKEIKGLQLSVWVVVLS